jgi:hypothetical protein
MPAPRVPRFFVASGALALSLLSGCIGVSEKRAPPPGVADFKSCRAGTRPADDGLLDDFEDGNNQATLAGGRDGYWWSAHDTAGSTLGPDPFAPSEGGADGSAMALRATGTTAAGNPTDAWGAEFGINFLSQKGALYDASKYAGISFKARVDEKSTRTVRFKIGDVSTHPDGQICKTCWNHFGKDMTFTPRWKEYVVLFSDARQEAGWGDPRPASITPNKLISLDFTIKGGQSYDLWIDDVTFLDCK